MLDALSVVSRFRPFDDKALTTHNIFKLDHLSANLYIFSQFITTKEHETGTSNSFLLLSIGRDTIFAAEKN